MLREVISIISEFYLLRSRYLEPAQQYEAIFGRAPHISSGISSSGHLRNGRVTAAVRSSAVTISLRFDNAARRDVRAGERPMEYRVECSPDKSAREYMYACDTYVHRARSSEEIPREA